MKKDSIITLIFIIVTLLIVVFIFVVKGNNSNNTEINSSTDENKTQLNYAQCIASKSVLYISTGCTACSHQKELFGNDYHYLNTIDCAITPENCNDITAVPTWIINNEQYKGVQSIETLKRLTEC
ncbi:MAG: hypothetical protein ABIE22_04870 [archaeon]